MKTCLIKYEDWLLQERGEIKPERGDEFIDYLESKNETLYVVQADSINTFKGSDGQLHSIEDCLIEVPYIVPEKEYFGISRLHRDDLKHIGFDTSNVDDATMNRLADKLSNDYCEQLFWNSLEILAECLNIPKKKKNEIS